MFKNYKNCLKAALCALLMGGCPQGFAQAVIFPQEKQAGDAQGTSAQQVYTLSNGLLSASFKQVGGMLTFEGCAAMDLQPSQELFRVELGNGSEKVTSSQMTLGKVEMKDLAGDPKAAKGSLRIPGKAIEATYTYKDLVLTWRAVLRNGSHYLRTEVNLKANKTTKMRAVVPMIYTVDNSKNETAPNVVGNTRGAILVSDKIFAGLETPMGINTVKSAASDEFNNYNPKAWTPASFLWNPGSELPEGIKGEHVKAMRGYMKFYTKGENVITFTKTEGDADLKIVGVDAVDLDGKVVAKDYRQQTAGTATYRLDIPAVDNYLVRYFVEEGSTCKGTIAYSEEILPAKVVFDGGGKKKAKLATAGTRALSKNIIGENEKITDNWTKESWTDFAGEFPFRLGEIGFNKNQVKMMEKEINITKEGKLTIEFLYTPGSGPHRLNIAGVALLDAQGSEATYDYHVGFTGGEKKDNVYTLYVPNAGKFKLRYYAETKTETIDSKGTINLHLVYENIVHLPAQKLSQMEGRWSRDVNLEAGKEWNVSAVVGLVAKDQPRRSILSYVERERAVPWRAYPIYNSWYELNINRNNDRNYDGNMHDYQCVDIVKQWEKNLYEAYGAGIKCFVWDDGWDIYGEWQFNKNFPNGFTEMDRLARAMEAGTGVWLGPVGGYGQSGNYRREYWANKGGMQLSNPEYYKVFYKGCTDLMMRRGYDFRYFKFDGISAQFSSVGPDAGTTGEENAEGIIYAELDMRKVQPDIFFNTSVGTWASPFWFSITDAVWRQENDYGEIGNNSNSRERWITYRDRLVYQNFVKNSPMCPINNLMTHGFILSDFGPVSKDRKYKNIVNEMRCAFACGSAMVELYCDYKLMNNIKNDKGEAGALWGDLAECIEWQEKNAEVLPDIHWVGGSPWNGSQHEIYGWAAWNGKNAVLTLRNGDNQEKTFTTTLREALEIPEYFKGSITLQKGFDQADLKGLETGKAINIDTELTLTLPGSSVYVFDDTKAKPVENYVVEEVKQLNNRTAYTVAAESKAHLAYSAAKELFVSTQAPTNGVGEQFAFVRNVDTPEGEYFLYIPEAKKFVSVDGERVVLSVEPMDRVTLAPVSEKDNHQFVVKFAGDKVMCLTKEGVKLVAGATGADSRLTLTAVNHKINLSDARVKVEDLYKYTRLDRSDWKVTASSIGSEANGVENLTDGNVNTFWQNKGDMPCTLTFDLGKAQTFCSFGYYARLNSEDGVCKAYVFEISDNGEDWKSVNAGDLKFENRKFVWEAFGKTVKARYARLTISANQAGNDLAAAAEFYLGHDGSKVTPVIYNLPTFSTEKNPVWYPVYFKNKGNYVEDKGAGMKLLTAAKNEGAAAQQWQFIGNEMGFYMKSKQGNYVCFHDDRFYATDKKEEADELQFIQAPEFYLELKVKDAAGCMNQYGGAGANKELGAYNQGDGGNILQVKPIEVPPLPEPETPVFSDEKNVVWYHIQFANGGNVIEDKGEGESVRLAALSYDAPRQDWKLVGERNNFQMVSRDGLYIVVSDEAEEQTGNQANANANPLRTSKEKYAKGFKMVATQNATHAPAWEILSNDEKFAGKALNQFAGTNVDRTISLWNLKDNNNPLNFVNETTTGIENVTGAVASKGVFTLTGIRLGDEVDNLPKGVYIVNGQKFLVK